MIKKWDSIPTPYYVVDEDLLKMNLEKLRRVKEASGCKVLLAQKSFSMFAFYKLIGEYLDGTECSSLFEAKLGYEEMGKENHIFSAAYSENDIDEIATICSHMVFNSFSQWSRYKDRVLSQNKNISCGIRINPEYSEVEKDIYNPCAVGSRLGVTSEYFYGEDLTKIEGLHFHCLCEQNSDSLERVLQAVEEKFGKYLYDMKWINFGGGHHITREDYDIERLISCIKRIKEKYNLEVYLEPGEAVVLNTGFLVSKVLDIVHNGMDICILDTSAACHMPDVIEMPYRPFVIGSGQPEEKAYTYKFGGPTCLAGDIIGSYSFDKRLNVGAIVVFTDMAHYTMVKNNTFNGFNLPSIATYSKKNGFKIIKEFCYTDFKNRLS